MDKLSVLQTTVGGLTSPGIIKAIKENGEREIRLIGTDGFDRIRGAYMVDKFYQVTESFRDEDKFIQDIAAVVEKEKIRLIVPCGNEDCLAVTKHIKVFEDLGAKVVSTPYQELLDGFDKGTAYGILKDKVPEGAPRYEIVTGYEGFMRAARNMGYPDSPIVIKPRHGRGGRGVMILEPDTGFKNMLSQKADINFQFDYIAELIKNEKDIGELIVMEYLPGTFYSAYSLCDRGEALITVPNVRLWGTPSQTLRGKVDMNERVIEAAKKAVKAFNFSYCINLELKISDDGRPVIYDINPRIAASSASLRATGVNIVYMSLKLALGEKFIIPPINSDVMMIRYFEEMYVSGEKEIML